jgi:glutamine phosphoribosylpyrophosphate amidotransferase
MESHVEADIVSTVPDSAIAASIGYANQVNFLNTSNK